MIGLKKSKEAMELSYSPYSNFKVGAALELTNGEFFLGANIENASYGLCNCAERTALFSAMAHGYKTKDFKALYVCAKTNRPISPCGACRQVMSELLDKDTKVYLTNLEGEVLETSVKELLPYSFDLVNDRV